MVYKIGPYKRYISDFTYFYFSAHNGGLKVKFGQFGTIFQLSTAIMGRKMVYVVKCLEYHKTDFIFYDFHKEKQTKNSKLCFR